MPTTWESQVLTQCEVAVVLGCCSAERIYDVSFLIFFIYERWWIKSFWKKKEISKYFNSFVHFFSLILQSGAKVYGQTEWFFIKFKNIKRNAFKILLYVKNEFKNSSFEFGMHSLSENNNV